MRLLAEGSAFAPGNLFRTESSWKSQVSASRQDFEATPSRREFITDSFILVSTSMAIFGESSPAFAEAVGSSPDRPVAILGGGGRTGKEVAAALAKEGIYGVTMTRTGKAPLLPGYAKDFISHFPESVDVIDADGLAKAVQSIHASAIVFCASASSQGGTAFQVDDAGAQNAAMAAKSLDARYVLVSALGVDRPASKGFQMTNSLGGNYDKIMDAKRQGEDKVRSILAKSKNYIIVRPGPLLGAKGKNGAADIEVNQGDTIGGGISRDELAGVVVGALLTDKKGATVEVYRTKTRQKIQPEFDLFSGNEYTSDSYVGLFGNVKVD